MDAFTHTSIKVFINSLPIMSFIMTFPERKILAINNRLSQETGYLNDEVENSSFYNYFSYVNPEIKDFLNYELSERGYFNDIEILVKTNNNEIKNYLVSSTLIMVDDLSCLLCNLVDISKQKELSDNLYESQAFINALINSTDDLIWSVDPKSFGLLNWNQALEDYFWHSSKIKIKIGDRPEELFPAESEFIQLWKNFYIRALDKPFSIEYKTKSGNFILQLVFNYIYSEGQLIGISVFGKDITEQKAAEKALRESENRFRSTFEQAAVDVAHVTPDGSFLRVNQRLCEIVGYSTEELMATNFQSITYQDDLTRDIELHNQMLNGVISTYSIEKRYIRKNRSTVWINLTVSPVKNDSGDLEYIISIIEDISDRKRVEADLQASEQLARKTANQLRLVHQIGTAITTGLDLEKLILTLYEECLHISDVDTFYIALYDETTGRLSFPINFKDGKQCAIPERNIKDEPGMVGYIIEGRKTLYIPNQSFIPSGIFPIKQPGIPTVSYLGIPLIVNDRVVGVFSIQSHALDAYTPDQIHTYELLAVPIALAIQNSLLYEQAQDEMHLSNALIDYQPGAFCLIDQQLKIVRWNKYAETLMGYTPEEAANLHLEDLFAVDEWDHITGLIDDVFNGKQVSFETQLKTKHGNLITMVMNATFYTAGDQTYLLAFGIDITDRKQAELEVRKSNERIERILHNLQDAYFQADLEGKFILVSPSAALLYRFNSSEEMVGLPAETLYADNTDRLALINKLRESSQLKDFRCKGLRKDGTTFWVSMNVQFVRDDSGQIIGTEGLVRDITEQYQFEEILLEKDLQFQSITATSPEPILVSRTSDGTILYANEQCGKMIGTSSDNLINQQTPDFYTHPSDRQTFLAMLKQGYVTNWEVSLKRLDGTDFWALVSARLGIFNGQEVIYAGIRDITEHKLAECELREREELFHSAFQSAIAGICMVDMEGKFIRVNQALCEILGYAEEELIQLRFHDVTLDEDRKTEIEIMDQLVAGEIDYARFEKRYIKKNKQIIWVTISTSAIHDNKGNPIYIVKYIQDITETKLANQKLQLREERYRSLVETQLGLISRSDVEGNLTFVNDAYCEAHGKSREELLSSSQHQYIHPEDLDLAAKAHKSLLEPPHHYIIEHRHITPKGMRWYRCEGSVIFDINGNILETQSVGTDIHDLKQSQNEMLNILEKLQKTLEGTIQTIDLITEARDPYTSGHQKRVAELSVAVAKELALPEDQIQGIYYAGLIHDLGKIQIPSEMLSKPGKLSKLEFDLIKTHPEAGYNMLKRIEFPWPLAEIVYQHHERMDGSGYPQKLKGDEILLEARIIGVADVIEAMSSHRPYRPALGMNVALEEIKKNKSILYDEKVTEVFIELIEQGYVFDS